jgi:hypothetical protein
MQAEAFDELLEEATKRTRVYERDFAAWTLLGVARCARALGKGTADNGAALIDQAGAAFQEPGRHNTEPTPNLTKLVLFLLDTMATDDVERTLLQPARDHLDQTLAAHSRA